MRVRGSERTMGEPEGTNVSESELCLRDEKRVAGIKIDEMEVCERNG